MKKPKMGRPTIVGRPLTQAERQARWRANAALRRDELLAADNSKARKRLNLALHTSTVDAVGLIAAELESSKTEVIERLIARGISQCRPILERFSEIAGRSGDEEVDRAQDLKWLGLFIRQGYSVEDLDAAYTDYRTPL